MSGSTKKSAQLRNLLEVGVGLIVLAILAFGLVLSVDWWKQQRKRAANTPETIGGSSQAYDKTKIIIDDTLEPLDIVDQTKPSE